MLTYCQFYLCFIIFTHFVFVLILELFVICNVFDIVSNVPLTYYDLFFQVKVGIGEGVSPSAATDLIARHV